MFLDRDTIIVVDTYIIGVYYYGAILAVVQ